MRRHPTATAWLMTMGMAAATMVAILVALPAGPPLLDSGVTWWMLAGVFALTEARPVHLLTSRGAHTLNPVEIPLLVGLAVLTGPMVVLARVVGALLYVGLVRRQDPLKAAFNSAAAGLGAATATVVASNAAGTLADPATWAWLVAGTVVGGLTTSLAVAVVLSVFDSGRTITDVHEELGVATAQVAVGSVIGLVVVVPLYVNAWSLIATAGVAVLFHGAFTVYGQLRRRHTELEAIYAFATSLDLAATLDDLLDAVAVGVARGLNVRRVELCFDAQGDRVHRSWIDGVLAPTADGADDAVAPADDDAIVAPLHSGVDTLLGWISASGREEEVSFGEADRRLLDAMASHAGASLVKAQVERRLRQEIVANEELIRSKDQLIAAVSHELRTPLTGILGFAEIMREGDTGLDTDTQREIATSIAGEALDLSFIVEDLLTAARFDLGQLTVKPHAVEVAALIEAVLEPIEQRSGRRFDRDLQPGPAWTDGARARQILRNLVANAVKYGGDHIEIRTARDEGLVMVDVCDDGQSLDPSDAERIFLPYQTAHESATQPGSVGLGLAISRELARLAGGDVLHITEPGWTVFRFTMPDGPSEAPDAPPSDEDAALLPGDILAHQSG